jgi:hypothetical protein
MAEALAAIALAGNVLQFLETGGKFAFRAFEILRYGSRGGGRSDLKDLRKISHDFLDLLKRLGAATDPNESPALAPLEALSMSCSDAVRELLEKLERIGVNSSHRRVGELVAEFKSTWHKGDIEGLEKRMKSFREELAIHLVVILR